MRNCFCLMMSCGVIVLAPSAQSSTVNDWTEIALTNKIGGVSVKQLVKQVDDAPTMKIRFDEIIVSNGTVVFDGAFSGIQADDIIIAPVFLKSALSGTILSEENSEDKFRLVADSELDMEDYLPWDHQFASSKLFVRHEGETKFRYSYAGFASDAENHINKIKMDRTEKFKSVTRVKYYTRRFVGVRFKGREYYPRNEDDYSIVNVDGDGSCKITIR